MANLRTNNLSGEQGQNAYRGSVNFVNKSETDYLQVSANSDLSLTGDFTIEYWTWISDSETHTRQVSSGNYYTAGKNGNWYFGLSPTSGNVVFYTYDAQSNAESVSISQTISLNSWHHAAAVRSGNTVTLYLNGISIGSGTVSKDLVDGADGGLQIGRLTVYGSHMGYISNFRILNGEALYTANFTPPFTELKAIPNTVLLCCQNSDDVTQEETGKTITGVGNLATAGYNKTQPKVIPPYGVDAGNTFGGPIQQSSQEYMYFPTGRTEERGRGRGFTGGGNNPGSTNTIQFVEIRTSGNSLDFGDLTAARQSTLGALANATRAIWGGGQIHPANNNIMDFITTSTTGNATDFGDLTVARRNLDGTGNQTRGLFCGGQTPTLQDVIDFVTIANLGNATDFGNLSVARSGLGAASSPTRGLFFGGNAPSGQDVIDFVTIASASNATDFGNLTVARTSQAVSSKTRAVVMGGNAGAPGYANYNSIDFVTIASAGNATDFGDLITAISNASFASNSIIGLNMGGGNGNTNTIEFITIATTGNGADYGDLYLGQGEGAGCSDSHGGI